MTDTLPPVDSADASRHNARPATVGQWLAACQPAPPPALVARLESALSSYRDDPVDTLTDACLAAGELMLSQLLATGATSRESALDLLAVDALVTYAFSAAADAPNQLEERAAASMVRIAAAPGTRLD